MNGRSPAADGAATFTSAFKPLYDGLVTANPGVAEAVELAIAFEEAHSLATPRVYASTAITSGGHSRDKSLTKLDDVIARNNRSAQLIMSALISYDAPQVGPRDVMLPTELGKVPSWTDSDYLLFYFAWLAGLSRAGAWWLEQRLAESVYAPILAVANDRSLENAQRWPHYRAFTEIALTSLALAEALPNGKRRDGSEFLLQLVDVQESLGCRAERLFADARGLDRVSVSFPDDLTGALGAEIAELRRLRATAGVRGQPVELVPVLLR